MVLFRRLVLPLLLSSCLVASSIAHASAQIGSVRTEQKLLLEARGLEAQDRFGCAFAPLGDLDGDGHLDFVTGAMFDDPPENAGAAWMFSMNADGTVAAEQSIPDPMPSPNRGFGSAFAELGDLDGDGVTDLAVDSFASGFTEILFLRADGTVRAHQRLLNAGQVRSLASLGDLDGDGTTDLACGPVPDASSSPLAIRIVFLNPDGTQKARQTISQLEGGFGGHLDPFDRFGYALASLGDLDGDGTQELAVGADGDDDGGTDFGAVWILSLNPDGTVASERKISALSGGFTSPLNTSSRLGCSLARIGDLDGDGVTELVAGAQQLRDGGNNHGGVFVLFLDTAGSVRTLQRISDTSGGFEGVLEDGDEFGIAAGLLGDLDADGLPEILVGSADSNYGLWAGAFWVLFLEADGSVRHETKVSDRVEAFGRALGTSGDLDGNGYDELAIGALGTDGGVDRGSVWLHFLGADGAVLARKEIGDGAGGFTGLLANGDRFGASIAPLGDLDGDGNPELAVGADGDDDGGLDQGAVWILSLAADGTVLAQHVISETAGGFSGALDPGDAFGISLACVGDLDGDGAPELAVGATGDDDGGTNQGAVWILFLAPDGSVRNEQKLAEGSGGLGVLDPNDGFGLSLAGLGDLAGNGTRALAVGAWNDDTGGTDQGLVRILFLGGDGTVQSQQAIGDGTGGFGGDLEPNDRFAYALAALDDLNADGRADLAVCSFGDDDGDIGQGAVWVLFLASDGTVAAHQKISGTTGGFGGALTGNDHLGSALTRLGDLDGDGVDELVAAAINDDDVDTDHGAAWILYMRGMLQLGFETEDDFETLLSNGQDVSSPEELGRLVSLTSAGPNAGAAVFDSTPGGPNDPSQDRDLLVGSGNLLILQTDASTAQTVPGIFDRPNDDENGGLFVFRFRRTVTAERVDLVDIDSGSSEASSVTLVDLAGLTRVYSVPPGWTGDLLSGAPARLTLDLRSLAPQPGHAATATASETPGFDPGKVIRIEIDLGGSGAVDRLAWTPEGSAELRTGPRARRAP